MLTNFEGRGRLGLAGDWPIVQKGFSSFWTSAQFRLDAFRNHSTRLQKSTIDGKTIASQNAWKIIFEKKF